MTAMRIQPEVDNANVVFVGDFNPTIFRVDWLGAQGLLSSEDVEAANIDVVHPDLSRFSCEWLVIQVERHRFLAETPCHPHVRLGDLVVRLFGDLLPHTPVGMVGINRTVEFPVSGIEMLDRIGERLAPQEAWGEWASHIKGTLEKHGGMRSITMEQRQLDDRENGHIRAKVEPSVKLKGQGVHVDVNDHYTIAEDPSKIMGCREAVEIVSGSFERSLKRSAWIIDQVMALARSTTND